MNLTYIASSGNTYNLSTRILTREANYHVWEFEPKVTELTYGERVSTFKKPAVTYQTTLIVRGSVTQRRAILTALHDDFENDVRTMQTGRLMYGSWYCDCYITASKTEPVEDMTTWTQNTIDIYVPSGFWIKEEQKSFSATAAEAYAYLDYTYDYQYDYSASASGSGTWVTDSPFASDFEMSIYGPAVNPRVTINGHPYIVYATVSSGETLVINSQNHTVMVGTTNHFDDRSKEYSVFEKIPAGTLTLTWDDFDFNLKIFEERSEPKWS